MRTLCSLMYGIVLVGLLAIGCAGRLELGGEGKGREEVPGEPELQVVRRHEGTLASEADDLEHPQVVIALKGGGTEAQPRLTLTPLVLPRLVLTDRTHDFGETWVGEELTWRLPIRNDGKASLRLRWCRLVRGFV